ncbi:MAG TPA: hypothetical protein VGC21_16760 [Telluria sp.]|jgi:hypothetical protein
MDAPHFINGIFMPQAADVLKAVLRSAIEQVAALYDAPDDVIFTCSAANDEAGFAWSLP